jgi:hypothetical protein
LIFFVYPDPKGSEEPSTDSSVRARRSQNQFTPLGDGVNKLIFEHHLHKFAIFLFSARIPIFISLNLNRKYCIFY